MDVKIYKCFIASPGDTVEERKACDRVFSKINRALGAHLGFRIESSKWESDSRPSFGEEPQAVISDQLLENYQLFIGIMWTRLGTPTKSFQSGTEEEFSRAYERYKSHADVEIMMYFNEKPASLDELDLDQVEKVREFKKSVSELGGLYWSYNGTDDFEEKLSLHINDYFVNLYRDKNGDEISGISGASEATNSVTQALEERLRESLKMFRNQPTIWVEPVISRKNDVSKSPDESFNSRVTIQSILESPKSTIIKAPPQFGLTSLANHLVFSAWQANSVWVFLDATKVRRDAIRKSVEKELRSLGLADRPVECIILDSWKSTDNGAKKLLRNLCHEYQTVPIIVMQTVDDVSFEGEEDTVNIKRPFDVLHLLALPRNHIRKVVSDYNNEKNIGDDDAVVTKIVSDMAALNIHRTPLNCITLLKVSENYFDESPVNRTKMIEMVLFVLFNMDEIPTYTVRPDLKDCEHVLGRFCEQLVRNRNFRFSREEFLNALTGFCEEKLLHLEVAVVFDVLYSNRIIMQADADFSFRSAYWIYYFAAKRMYSDTAFKKYMLDEQRYVSYPEVIEFYTGIDRDRADILEILTNDLRATCSVVEEKTGLPDSLNPLDVARWQPTDESLAEMQDLINDDILNSKLPDFVKDQYADRDYNQLRPYDQSVYQVFREYSFIVLIQKIKASSRALRNSDYVDPDLKRALLREITRGWKQISKVLFALAPMLAEKGQAAFEGQTFILGDGFASSTEEKIKQIFLANPVNIINMFRFDLFSSKIGPLIFDSIRSEPNSLIRHMLILLLITERPLNWRKHVEAYIAQSPKDSFYLYDAVCSLSNMCKYAFGSDTEISEIKYLLKAGYAKHQFGGGKPKLEQLKKISNRVIPKREVPETSEKSDG